MSYELKAVRPASVEELGDAVRGAAAEGHPIYPFGGRTMFDYGLPPARPGVGIDIRGLNQVIDYPARDMTITVRAGITMAELQAVLAAEKQQLPIDVPAADRATLGGVLATNTSGPRRLGYGTLRDYVLGMSVVNDEGRETKAGGRVVKNVAGYDLCKLYVGSLGTLGVITQATLKLRPGSEENALLVTGCEAENLEGLLDTLHSSDTRPVCLELLNRAALDAVRPQVGYEFTLAPWVAVIGVEGNREAVAWQVRQLGEEISRTVAYGFERPTGQTFAALWRVLVEFPLWPQARLAWKANLLPSATAAFCRTADALSERLLLQAHAGSGIVVGHVLGDLTPERAATIVRTLLGAATAAQGNLVVVRCPPEWKQLLPVWGQPRSDWRLMKKVKHQLDPGGLFNPGRLGDF